jgi:hypothetical protein
VKRERERGHLDLVDAAAGSEVGRAGAAVAINLGVRFRSQSRGFRVLEEMR